MNNPFTHCLSVVFALTSKIIINQRKLSSFSHVYHICIKKLQERLPTCVQSECGILKENKQSSRVSAYILTTLSLFSLLIYSYLHYLFFKHVLCHIVVFIVACIVFLILESEFFSFFLYISVVFASHQTFCKLVPVV